MKLLLTLLVVATLAQFSVALFGFARGKNGFLKNRQRSLHREPLIDRNAIMAAAEVVETKWIQQRLDNFNPQDRNRWSMRYMENNFFLQEGGPIFIYVGGEWTISAGWLRTGHMYDMARQLNGTMFYTEHRYYGESRPTEDLTTENLRFLNVDQALADLAHFIEFIKSSIPEVRNSGVILVGASYSATMVTWFIQKYPHLANGAWSSSAPLEAKVDFVEYFEVVSEAMELLGGSTCTDRIRNAFAELEQLVADGNATRIRDVLHLCDPLDLANDLDVMSVFSDMAGPFAGIVQYYREADQDIQNECDLLVNIGTEDDLEAFARWWWWPIDIEDPTWNVCYSHAYSDWIYYFNGTGWDDLAGYYEIRQWYYQTCAEYGWYQTSSSDDILFGSGFPVDLSVQICHDLYSGIFSQEIIEENANRTNVIYGAKNPSVRNVYSTHGQLDPWRPMGVQEDINEFSPTVILPLEAHCSDLYSASDRDSPEMRASKEKIFDLVRQWLGISIPVPESTPSPDETSTTTPEAPSTTTDE